MRGERGVESLPGQGKQVRLGVGVDPQPYRQLSNVCKTIYSLEEFYYIIIKNRYTLQKLTRTVSAHLKHHLNMTNK